MGDELERLERIADAIELRVTDVERVVKYVPPRGSGTP